MTETAESFYRETALRLRREDRLVNQPVAMWVGAIFGDSADDDRQTAEEPVIEVFVEVGRFVAQCPFCPSAQVASKTDHRFFCYECKNAEVGGKYVPTVWPVEE